MRTDFPFIVDKHIPAISLWMHRRIDNRACAGCELAKNYEGPSIMKERCWECWRESEKK